MPRTHRAAEDRFWEKVDKPNDGDHCWTWTGALSSNGYGSFVVSMEPLVKKSSHAVAYEFLVGQVPSGLVLDHLCRNRRCVNPGHLEPVTQKENTLRGKGPAATNASKTHCIHGHEFTEQNIRWRTTKYGLHRRCRACERQQYETKKRAKEELG